MEGGREDSTSATHAPLPFYHSKSNPTLHTGTPIDFTTKTWVHWLKLLREETHTVHTQAARTQITYNWRSSKNPYQSVRKRKDGVDVTIYCEYPPKRYYHLRTEWYEILYIYRLPPKVDLRCHTAERTSAKVPGAQHRAAIKKRSPGQGSAGGRIPQ